MKCPTCDQEMVFVHVCGIDYDRWGCVTKYCGEEVELDATTYPDGYLED